MLTVRRRRQHPGSQQAPGRATLRLPSVSDTLQMMQEAFGACRAVVADLDDARRRAAWAEVGDCLKQFEADGSFKTDFEIAVGSGAKAA